MEKNSKLPQAQEWILPICRKSSKGGRKCARMNRELLIKLRHQKEAYKKAKEDPGDSGGIWRH